MTPLLVILIVICFVGLLILVFAPIHTNSDWEQDAEDWENYHAKRQKR